MKWVFGNRATAQPRNRATA